MLAAGSGSRFGGGKLTAAWGPGVLLQGALAAAFAAPAVPAAHSASVPMHNPRVAPSLAPGPAEKCLMMSSLL